MLVDKVVDDYWTVTFEESLKCTGKSLGSPPVQNVADVDNRL